MKKIITLLAIAVAAVSLTSCHGCGKRGNGHVITEERKVDPFDRIIIDGTFPVELSQNGGPTYVKVETDQNLQQYISVFNEGGELTVKTNENITLSRSTKMKVFINVQKLKSLEFNSVGSLTTTNQLKLDSLVLNSQSVGKMDLDIDSRYLHADLKSVGNTTLRGKVHEARINNRSVGTLSAFGLKADTLMIHNTAVGSAEVYADSAFYIRSSAVGVLYYKGPGELLELKSEGIGKVQKKD